MIYAYKRNIESEAETELEEEGRTDSQKTNGLEFFGVSQAPPDKMMDADQSKTKSVEEMELVEVGKMDSQKTNVADNSQDKNKIHILMMNADQGIEYVKDMELVDVGRTNSQKTHMEDTPEISDDSQEKDMEHKKEEHTSNKDK